jgi:hypothetical protein
MEAFVVKRERGSPSSASIGQRHISITRRPTQTAHRSRRRDRISAFWPLPSDLETRSSGAPRRTPRSTSTRCGGRPWRRSWEQPLLHEPAELGADMAKAIGRKEQQRRHMRPMLDQPRCTRLCRRRAANDRVGVATEAAHQVLDGDRGGAGSRHRHELFAVARTHGAGDGGNVFGAQRRPSSRIAPRTAPNLSRM